jgi:hypothetical protein
MKHLILSVDYELFGNGTGDVYKHVVNPASRIARLGQNHGIPFTFFFEIEEYLKHKEYTDDLNENLGYDPARIMEDQVKSLISNNHDVQLHIHPQWFDAKYKNSRWVLHEDQISINNLFKEQEEVDNYIASRKAILEQIIEKGKPRRKIKAFRAGGFCAQPGEKLISALARNNILIECSVVRGLYQPPNIDYRQVYSLRSYWPVKNDVCKEDHSGVVYEVPIYSLMRRRFHQLTLTRLKAKFSSNVPKIRKKELLEHFDINWNPIRIMKFLCQAVPIKLDFNNLEPRTLIKWITNAKQINEDEELNLFVLIGHTKEQINDNKLNRFLELVSKDPNLKVITFAWFADYLEERKYEIK